MKLRGSRSVRLLFLAILASLAMVLSYLELLLPPLLIAVPGIKIGLPNIVIIYVLFRLGWREAGAVSLLRIGVSALLFGNALTLLYSLAGATLSLTVMLLLRKIGIFSTVGVSVAGGVAHNAGQILVAVFLLNTPQIAYYMIVLTVTGTVAGILVGLSASLFLKYSSRIPLEKYLN